MKTGYLSEYVEAVAAKRLRAVEINPSKSNQHEFNGDRNLKTVFGTPTTPMKYQAHFLYLNDEEDESISANGFVRWYDARKRSTERTGRSEYRMYFPSTEVSGCASEGDLLILCRLPQAKVLAVIAEANSTIESQLIWLFGLENVSEPDLFFSRDDLEREGEHVGLASRTILEAIGIEIEEREDNYLDDMLARFGRTFPATRIFSEYARSTLPDLTPENEPDQALLAWLDREELLFRSLERELVSNRLRDGFAGDVDGFISFSLSIQNRRKSRAGAALENHLEFLFAYRGIRFDRGPVTENRSKPDFLFPGIAEYSTQSVPESQLSMLAAKSSCKDRWRQVLSEADRIAHKHLATLEPAISEAQTDEMRSRNLQLVLPAPLHQTYSERQSHWLMSLTQFLEHIEAQQN